jgi:predicted transposase/invertase (TIGR01784 family)
LRTGDEVDGTTKKPHETRACYEGSALLPLKSDVIFKLVFGDPRYIEITRAFLTATLDIPVDEFEDLQIVDPHLERDRPNDKLGILDVRIQLKSGKLISVEIQIRKTPFMAKRVAFSTGRNLSRQIEPGQNYRKIEKVITIVITGYNMIETSDSYHHIFRLYDAEHEVQLTDIMEVHTLELAKTPEGQVEDGRERELVNWLRLIRSESREEIEMLGLETREMELAVGRLKKLSADERARMLYEARELAEMDEMARMEAAIEEGIERGRTEGIKEGIEQSRREIAEKMLRNGFDVEMTSMISGLSAEEVRSLKL